jgi:hypothetical protein
MTTLEDDERVDLLGNEQYVDCTKVEFIVKRQSSKTVISRMYTSIELRKESVMYFQDTDNYSSHHDRLAFVLYDMT